MNTVQDLLIGIRKRYKAPVTIDYINLLKSLSIHYKNHYCVGGAFCRYVRNDENFNGFPNPYEIATEIGVFNNKIKRQKLVDYAHEIMIHNDAGRFTEAWNTLRKALTDEG